MESNEDAMVSDQGVAKDQKGLSLWQFFMAEFNALVII